MKNALYLTLMVLISFLGGYFTHEFEPNRVDALESLEFIQGTSDIQLEQDYFVDTHTLKEAPIGEEVSIKDAQLSCKTHGNIVSKDIGFLDSSKSNVIKEITVSPSTNLLAEVVIIARVQNGKIESIQKPILADNIAIIKTTKSNNKDLIKLMPNKYSVTSTKPGIKQNLLANYAYNKSFNVTITTYICQLLPVESTSCLDSFKKSSLDFGIEAKARSPGLT